jgi:DNA-binding transcriptional LysR family regulator
MDSNKIETFLMVCRHESFTKAADKLFITSAAVKKQIDSLEDELGVQLFLRKSSGCVLTPPGEIFQSESKKILKAINTAAQRVQKAEKEQEYEIHIGYSVKLDYNFLHDISSAYTEQYPNHCLRFERMKKSELTTALYNQTIDCFIIINPQKSEFKRMKKVTVAETQMYAVMQKNHPLTQKKTVTFDDLVPYDVYLSSVLDNSLYEDFESVIGSKLHILDQADRNDLMVSLIKNAIILYPCPVTHDICVPFEYRPLPVCFYYLENDEELVNVCRIIQHVFSTCNKVIM